MKKKRKRSNLCLLFLSILIGITSIYAQNGEGDQFLDGIGETALIARYLFNGNVKDCSRNSYHADLKGQGAFFDEDEQFGKVLSLSGGKNGAYVEIPGQALVGLENLSITGWINVRDLTPWQCFFDLGQDKNRCFYCAPVGEERSNGCLVRITAAGYSQEQGPATFRVMTGQWVHLAAVLDATKKTLSLYIDGVRVGRSTGVKWSMVEIFNQDNAAANRLYIGKSLNDEYTNLAGKVYDVRFYRIALTDKQVAVIRHNAVSDEDILVTEGKSTELAVSQNEECITLLTDVLTDVPDIKVQTIIGHLPHLPYYIPGIYRDGVDGSLVRVIWPAPTDTSDVVQARTYTVTGTVPGTVFTPKAIVTVLSESITDSAPQRNLEPFPLGQVLLGPDREGHDTPFIKNRDKFILGLAKTDPNTFLYNFRDAFGQQQPEGVHPLRGWDSQTTRLRGHASGHYLTAIAQAWASTTYDEELHANFSQKMDYMIEILYDLSQKSGKPATEGGPFNADPTTIPPGQGRDGYDSDLSKNGIRTDYWNWGEGFISGYPPDQFIMLEQGATYGGRNNQIWAPYYTLHKILAGLMDCYEVGGNPKALKIAKGMGIWVYKRLKVVPKETRIRMWNRYIAGEYGGMNEVMARLHRITGDARFLECARMFDNIDFFFGNAAHEHGLAKNVDTIRGKHANQHIPQITGSLEIYKGTKEITYYEVAENFWNICTNCYMYCIGGVAGAKNPNNAECFTIQPNTLHANGFSQGGQNETCATYNMLKLSRQLFMFDQDAKYMDYYEQALYNHILASVDKNNPGNTYHVPLNPGARKNFGNARMNGFTCCNGTALESSTKLQDSIYFKSTDNSALYVNLYVPSTLKWSEKKVVVTQRTSFPYADNTTLILEGGATFSIHVRVPKWATQGFFVKLNGEDYPAEATVGSYLTLSRNWQDGDVIELKMPMDFYLCPVMDKPNIASIFYGPVLLAVEEIDSLSKWRPVTLDADDISKSFSGDPATLRFSTNGVNLKPFFEIYGRYSVYLDVTLK
ncbi:MAG: glycoside hydrolase family 127 protein [Sedimentisphaerales bacterium]|nr:glycoside hydrolase family 127 protein [Sedimentisphaerales bacterium]